MNKKKTLGFMVLALSSVVVLAGCTTNAEKEKQLKFTEAEEKTFVESFAQKVLKPELPTTIVAEMDKNIDRVSKNEASNMVDGLLYAIHQQNPEMNAKIAGLQVTFAELESKKIDFNKPANLEKVKDETTKAFLKEAQSKKYLIQKVGTDFLARPDINFVLKTYGKYMNDDLKVITQFSLEETEKPFFNASSNMFDMNIVVERILKVEENMKKFPDSFYKTSLENSKNYYYQVYFGTNNSFLVDKNNVVLPAILAHYKDTVKKHPDSQIGKDTQKVLDELAKTDNKVTDNVNVFLLELTGTQSQDVKEEADATEEKATEKVNDAIQEAIKQNEPSTEGSTGDESTQSPEQELPADSKK